MSDTLEMESVVETLPVPRPHRERSDIKPFVPDGDRAAIYRALSTQIEIGGTAVDAANRIKQALTALGELPSAMDRRQRDFRLIFIERVVEAFAKDEAILAMELKVVADLCPAEFMGAYVKIHDLKRAKDLGRYFAQLSQCVNRTGI